MRGMSALTEAFRVFSAPLSTNLLVSDSLLIPPGDYSRPGGGRGYFKRGRIFKKQAARPEALSLGVSLNACSQICYNGRHAVFKRTVCDYLP
jgi:hypothetical protein